MFNPAFRIVHTTQSHEEIFIKRIFHSVIGYKTNSANASLRIDVQEAFL
ncbi:hypothetical protein [Leptospira santarosai]|nr:hypothetical protein [Leptospira santarosai]